VLNKVSISVQTNVINRHLDGRWRMISKPNKLQKKTIPLSRNRQDLPSAESFPLPITEIRSINAQRPNRCMIGVRHSGVRHSGGPPFRGSAIPEVRHSGGPPFRGSAIPGFPPVHFDICQDYSPDTT